MNIKRVSIRLNQKLHTALRYISIEDNTTLQDMFLEAIEEKYMDRILESKKKNW